VSAFKERVYLVVFFFFKLQVCTIVQVNSHSLPNDYCTGQVYCFTVIYLFGDSTHLASWRRGLTPHDLSLSSISWEAM